MAANRGGEFLTGEWRFRPIWPDVGYHQPTAKPLGWRKAIVPGCVHLDLLREGVIPDPFERSFEHGVQWVDDTDWEYECTFDVSAETLSEDRALVFHGLDTVVDAYLNDHPIGSADNAFLPHKFLCGRALQNGENILRLVFHSSVKTGAIRRRAWMLAQGLPKDIVWFDERAFVRKPAYAFGWDWGPRLVGAGITVPIEFCSVEEEPELDVTVRSLGDRKYEVSATLTPDITSAVIELHLSSGDARIVGEPESGQWIIEGGEWWPRGMGPQTLHIVRCTLPGGPVLEKKIGLRHLEFLRQADEIGESFEFRINSQPIWARGANWIPADSFPVREDAESTKKKLETYANFNFNLIRVWGGGRYETDRFYETCDELGLLVWQDFPFACMYYPDDEAWQSTIRSEAEFHVKRLRHHASLALWCGNNENLQMFQQKWGGVGSLPERYFGEALYESVLPDVVARLDPERGYIATSPIGIDPSPDVPNRDVNMDRFGDSHYWDVWHGRGDWKHYADSRTRFSSEFGFASSCSLAAWQSVLSEQELLRFPNDTVHSHNKTGKAWATFLGYVESHYPKCESLEDWVYYSQLNQRDALRYGIEHFRTLEGCRGSLIWQANDCWPVQSWSVQDWTAAVKPAGFELGRLYADVLIATDFLPGQSQVSIWVANDSRDTADGDIQVTVHSLLTGERSSLHIWTGEVEPNHRLKLTSFDVSSLDPTTHVIEIHSDRLGAASRWVWLSEPRDLKVPKAQLNAHWDGNLKLNVSGIALDLVIWDPDDHTNVRSRDEGPHGWEAKTVVDQTVHYFAAERPRRLFIRTLAGFVELIVTS